MTKHTHLGVVPDFSIFQKKPHRLLVERLVRAGFREDKLTVANTMNLRFLLQR